MINRDITVKIRQLAYDELSPADADLVEQARQATFRSYAPYSRFCVGAAILLSNGEVITGANQENAAYPSGTCAERSACYYAHARYPEAKFVKIAVAARGTDGEFVDEPAAPCGACRQALLEYETLAGAPVEVLLAGRDRIYVLESVKSTLPLAFDSF
ncbi:MAG: cytidine deaminase [[Clostridium] fimetarium]|nr:cytidine deaminase [Alistipes timonensis]MCM1406667.1 cytidine deaminase [[Clostridium] fimetarium]